MPVRLVPWYQHEPNFQSLKFTQTGSETWCWLVAVAEKQREAPPAAAKKVGPPLLTKKPTKSTDPKLIAQTDDHKVQEQKTGLYIGIFGQQQLCVAGPILLRPELRLLDFFFGSCFRLLTAHKHRYNKSLCECSLVIPKPACTCTCMTYLCVFPLRTAHT